MAVVEDEVRNDSEEENEIEVVVEEDDPEQDSDDSDVCMHNIRYNLSHCLHICVLKHLLLF